MQKLSRWCILLIALLMLSGCGGMTGDGSGAPLDPGDPAAQLKPELATQASAPPRTLDDMPEDLADAEIRARIDGVDNRVMVGSTTSHPYRTVCKIYSTFPNGQTVHGTGTMIGPKHVLTAGHFLYDSTRGGYAGSITVIPALNGTYQPYGSSWAVRTRVLDGWATSASLASRTAYDMGVITLQHDLGNTTGWLNMTVPTGGFSMNTYNYAEDKRGAGDAVNGLRQWISSGQAYGVTNLMCLLQTDLAPGLSSGGPLRTGAQIRGIACGDFNGSNFGVILNSQRVQQINGWIAEDRDMVLALNPNNPRVDDNVTLTVTNGQPNQFVMLGRIAPGGSQLPMVDIGRLDGAGNFSTPFTIVGPAGDWTYFVQDYTGRRSQNLTLTVRPKPVPPTDPMQISATLDGSVVNGTVLNLAPESPVAVKARLGPEEKTITATSDVEGKATFSFTDLTTGRWEIAAFDTFSRQSNLIEVTVGGELQLAASANQQTLTATASNAVPALAVTFTVTHPGGTFTEQRLADPSGIATIEWTQVPPGAYSVQASDTVRRFSNTVEVVVQEQAPSPLTLEARVDRLRIECRILNAPRDLDLMVGAYLPATGESRSQTVRSTAMGEAYFSWDNLTPGTWQLGGYVVANPQIQVSPLVEVVVGQPSLSLTPQVEGLSALGEITGARPGQSVWVEAVHQGTGQTHTTTRAVEADGMVRFRFDNLAPGSWRLSGHIVEEPATMIDPPVFVTIQAPSMWVNAQVYDANVYGEVRDGPPYTNVRVYAEKYPEVRTFDAFLNNTGNTLYYFEGLTPGTWQIRAESLDAPGVTASPISITIAGPEPQQPLTVEAGANGQAISGQVRNATYPGNVVVTAVKGSDTRTQDVQVDALGNAYFNFYDLPAGDWTLTADDMSPRLSNTLVVTVAAPPQPAMSISASSSSMWISGSVSNATRGQQVTFYAQLGTSAPLVQSSSADDNGTAYFTFTTSAEGSYTVWAVDSMGRESQRITVTVTAPSPVLTASASWVSMGGTIYLTVTNAPPNAQISLSESDINGQGAPSRYLGTSDGNGNLWSVPWSPDSRLAGYGWRKLRVSTLSPYTFSISPLYIDIR